MSKHVLIGRHILALGLVFQFGCLSLNYSAMAAEDTTNAPKPESNKGSALHRLDFRIEGKSCAACLLSIQRKLNSMPGVKDAVVMLKRPFGASVVYESSEINQDELLTTVKGKEPNVKLVEISDSGISKVPSVLIPPFVPMQETK